MSSFVGDPVAGDPAFHWIRISESPEAMIGRRETIAEKKLRRNFSGRLSTSSRLVETRRDFHLHHIVVDVVVVVVVVAVRFDFVNFFEDSCGIFTLFGCYFDDFSRLLILIFDCVWQTITKLQKLQDS